MTNITQDVSLPLGQHANNPTTPEQDLRESLYNDRATGSASSIQLPMERITTLHGILFDLDPQWLFPENPFFPPADTPTNFYEGVKPVLARHPLVRSAEVRSSGTGLHLIIWLRPALELHSSGEQTYWDHIIRALQRTLPVDPSMPGITALTRPLGAINHKNGAKVEVLKAGEAIESKTIETFMAGLAQAPFREIARILLGEERVHPCPLCRGEGTHLDALDRVGICYGSCGKVTGDRLYDLILVPLSGKAKSTTKTSPEG